MKKLFWTKRDMIPTGHHAYLSILSYQRRVRVLVQSDFQISHSCSLFQAFFFFFVNFSPALYYLNSWNRLLVEDGRNSVPVSTFVLNPLTLKWSVFLSFCLSFHYIPPPPRHPSLPSKFPWIPEIPHCFPQKSQRDGKEKKRKGNRGGSR